MHRMLRNLALAAGSGVLTLACSADVGDAVGDDLQIKTPGILGPANTYQAPTKSCREKLARVLVEKTGLREVQLQAAASSLFYSYRAPAGASEEDPKWLEYLFFEYRFELYGAIPVADFFAEPPSSDAALEEARGDLKDYVSGMLVQVVLKEVDRSPIGVKDFLHEWLDVPVGDYTSQEVAESLSRDGVSFMQRRLEFAQSRLDSWETTRFSSRVGVEASIATIQALQNKTDAAYAAALEVMEEAYPFEVYRQRGNMVTLNPAFLGAGKGCASSR